MSRQHFPLLVAIRNDIATAFSPSDPQGAIVCWGQLGHPCRR